MRYARVASRVFNTPLLIEPGRLLPITNYLLGRMQGQAPAEIWMPTAGPAAESPEVEIETPGEFDELCGFITSDGIAVISFTGELLHRPAPLLDAKSGLLSYLEIEAKLDAALADDRVRGILLEVDSPGGESAGCFTLADKIFNARAAKPIWALANECATSAAYALACACDRVLMPESAHVGSVGVIMQALDQSKLDQAVGLQYVVISYGARKNDFNPHFPISKEAFAWASAEVERLGEQFVALVARNRGLDPKAVRATEAGLLFGPAAVEAGFADAILEPAGAGQTLVTKAAAMLAASMQTKFPGGPASPAVARNSNPTTGASPMSKEEQKAAGGAQAQPAGEQAAAQAQTAALEAARAEGHKAGADAERSRIAAILNHPEATGREAVARGLALESSLDAEAAGKILAGAPKAAPNPLAHAMAGLKDPGVGPDAPAAQAPGNNIMGRVMSRRLGLAPGQKGGM